MTAKLSSEPWVDHVIEHHMMASGPMSYAALRRYCKEQTTASDETIARRIRMMDESNKMTIGEDAIIEWNYNTIANETYTAKNLTRPGEAFEVGDRVELWAAKIAYGGVNVPETTVQGTVRQLNVPCMLAIGLIGTLVDGDNGTVYHI